jgi:outer membrane protein TolC
VQPILTGGQLRAERSKRRAQQREALANLQSTVLTACSEVETALAVDRLLAGRERALAEAMIEAGEAADEARVDYRAGVGDVLTVLAAQNRALRARSEHLATLRARLDNRVDLHLALGGDYRPATR